MSMGFIKDGKYVQVAGNPPPSGELVMGASTIRKGTVSVSNIASDAAVTVNVTFDSPMPDDDYTVTIRDTSPTWIALTIHVLGQTKNGFTLGVQNTSSTAASNTYNFAYTAAKLYTVEGVEELEAKVAELEAKVAAPAKVYYKKIEGTFPDNTDYQGTIEMARTGNVVSVKISSLRPVGHSFTIGEKPGVVLTGLPTCATNKHGSNDNTHAVLHSNGPYDLWATAFVQHDSGDLMVEQVKGGGAAEGTVVNTGLFMHLTYITDQMDYDYSDWTVLN